MRLLAVLVSLASLQMAEQRVLDEEPSPSSTRTPTIVDPVQGLDVLGGEPQPGVMAASAVPPPSAHSVVLNVRASDVEALTHYLRAHYRRMWLRKSPLTHLDAELGPGQCDPDECYSNCYLQGFHGGNCKENKCFCTTAPPVPPVNQDDPSTT